MPLSELRDRTFTLPGLAAEVGRWCAAMPNRSADDRVASTADERTLRYYQSIGLLDRPLRYDGRQAIYGHRHLLQALSAKALQARGYTLAQVQRALAGASTTLLEEAVAEALGGAAPEQPPPAGPNVAPPVPPRASPTPWASFALAPGVIVSLDPALHPDSEAVARALAAAFASYTTSTQGPP